LSERHVTPEALDAAGLFKLRKDREDHGTATALAN
jgi:hypothetical protein